MNIKNVEILAYTVPLKEPVKAYAAGLMTGFGMVVVKITDEDGNTGQGYTCMMSNQELGIARIIEDIFKPILINSDSSRIEYLWEQMWRKTHYVGRGGPVSFAIAAVDAALWDLLGQRLEQPLWRILGGYSPKVKVYAGNIDLNFPISKILENSSKNIEDGFKAIKMRLGRESLKEDIKRVEAVRTHIGDDIELMADANEAWRVDQALKASNELSNFDLTWLEEPITPDDYQGYSYLRNHGKTPLASGENLHTLREFQLLMSFNGVDFPEPDYTTCGGFTPLMKIAKLAEAYNLPIITHGAHDTHIQLLAACPNAAYMEVHAFGIEDYISNPLKMENGYGIASDLPGIGFEFNFDKLKQYKTN
ncbi:MAG: 3,6-anhydro-alpha-L-galactonate cycloisomerase [Alphaproteobacteria bacterium MarineAlpha9_Bin3]|nr:MAG: 3,6-anhydro-alpha-L-galactonate cycloisomerase [Alphaproteobacteria bacterium MarineAlpha9_Bin3]|tara:strand:- start:454 stop:1542 length:1089 start_codon:yes stop_codon:yes gene_type:complete